MLNIINGTTKFVSEPINIVITKNTSNTLPKITKYIILLIILITEQNNTINNEKYLETINKNLNNSNKIK